MISISENTKKRILYLITIIILFFIIKPSIFFTPNGNLRAHGVGFDSDGYKKSLYSFHYFIIIIAVLLFVLIN